MVPIAPFLSIAINIIPEIVGPIRVGIIVAVAVATVDVIYYRIADIASAIICPRGYIGFKVEIECLPPAIASSEAMDRAALQHIAAGIPEVANYYIPAASRAIAGEIHLELVEEASLGYLEALPMTHIIMISRFYTKPGAIVLISLAYHRGSCYLRLYTESPGITPWTP
jgi:hypothetical protein